MLFTFIKLNKNSDVTQYSTFDCNYDDHEVAWHLKKHIDGLCKYLSDDSLNALSNDVGITRVVYDDKTFVGFFTVVTGSLKRDDLMEIDANTFCDDSFMANIFTYPALKIVCLATHKDHRHKGVGTEMLRRTLAIAKSLSRHTGIRFIIVDALADKSTLDFYNRKGFKPHKKKEKVFREVMEERYQAPKRAKPITHVPMYLDMQKQSPLNKS